MLSDLDEGESFDEVLPQLAILMTRTKASPWYGRTVLEEPVKAAYRDYEAGIGNYPTGASSIRSYISQG